MIKGQLTDTKEPIFIQCDLQLALCGACNYVQLSVVNTLHHIASNWKWQLQTFRAGLQIPSYMH